MNYEEFSKELATKKRSVTDLSRYISTRTDHNPNYTLLLGAGCSVSSGVRSASTLVELWRKELYEIFAADRAIPTATADQQREFLKAHQGAWYDPAREYSCLFEMRYDLQRQRRMFVEVEVAGKTPSIGYAYLTSLVEQNYFNTVFTTNFDDLINEAFYVYSEQRPVVCAHDSSINSVTVTSKRPKLIKLHGDYLFDDLKSTARETETLEQNMKAKFAEFSKDYGLIVVGYSGGDRSIMDVVSTLLKSEEYFKNGVYWCIRKGSEISEELRKLMWKERVYFVEVDGFDELFAEFYAGFNSGDVLPSNAISINRRPYDVAKKILAHSTAFPLTSPVLKKARERLERQTKRTTLANLIVNPESDDNNRALSAPGLEDDDLIVLMEVQGLISSQQHRQAIEKAREGLRGEIKSDLRLRLLMLIVQAHRSLGEINEAVAVNEELIGAQPKNSSHYLRKASLMKRRAESLQCIELAIDRDPYSVDAYLDKARILSAMAEGEFGHKKSELLNEARGAVDSGLQLDPSWRNPCWGEKFDLLGVQELDRKKCQASQGQIVDALNAQNPYSIRVLTMRQVALVEEDPPAKFDELLLDIEEARDRADVDKVTRFDVIKLNVLSKLGDMNRLENAVGEAKGDGRISDPTLVITLASVLRKKFGRDLQAKDLLSKFVEIEFDSNVFGALFELCLELNENVEAAELYEKWRSNLSSSLRHRLWRDLLEAKGEFAEALSELKRYEDETGEKNTLHATYLNLRLNKFKAAEELARSVLEPIHYSAEAGAIIVNLEFARKKLDKKVNVERLEAVRRSDPTPSTQAAIYAILGQKKEMIESLQKAMKKNLAFRFQATVWPVFESYRADADFVRTIKQ